MSSFLSHLRAVLHFHHDFPLLVLRTYEEPDHNLLSSGDHIVVNHVECSEFKGHKVLILQAPHKLLSLLFSRAL